MIENTFTEVPLEQESYVGYSISVVSVCEVCGKSMSQLEYDKHLRTHREKRVESCEICLKTFTNLSNYKYHMAHHSNDRPWLCSECPKNYKTKIDLLQHQRVHDKARDPFRCDTCGQLFRTRSTFNTHQRTHTAKGPQKCNLCDKVFVNLRSHQQMVHQGVRHHQCTFCDKAFGKKSGLDRHVLTVHQKLRMWACDLCEKSFGEKAQLQRHQKVHLQARSEGANRETIIDDQQVFYKNKIRMRCGICRKIVNSKAALKRHKLLIHEKRKDILCDFCPKLFGERANLKRHILKHHLEESNVKEDPGGDDDDDDDETLAITMDKAMVQQLGFTETFPCSTCEKVLTTSWGLRVHEEVCLIKQQTILNQQGEDSDEMFAKVRKVEEVFLVAEQDEKFEIKQEPIYSDETQENHVEDLNVEPLDAPIKEEYLEEALEEEDIEQQFEVVLNTSASVMNDAGGELIEYEYLDDVEVLRSTQGLDISEDVGVDEDESPIETELQTLPYMSPQRFKCKLCPRTFKEVRYFQSHVSTVHSKKKDLQCNVKGCDESFVYRAQRMRHLRQKHPEIYEDSESEKETEPLTQIECELCNVMLDSQEDLDCHVENDHEEDEDDEKNRTCESCKPKKTFKKIQIYLNHVQAVHSDETFECPQCPKTFSFKCSLGRHIRGVHENIKNSKCDESGCDKSFLNSYELRQHQMSAHNKGGGNKSARTCDICLKVFKKTKYMEIHKASVHDTETQYFCPICNRGFSFQRSMDRHIRAIHEDRKDFICSADGCEKAFRSRYEVNEHFNNIHAHFKKLRPIEEVTCDVCEKVCSSKKVLYSHKKMVHEGVKWGLKFECKLCKENFESKYKKSKHWGQVHRNGKVKMRTCHVCATDFQLFDDYKTHIMSEHEGSCICFICGHDFNDESSLFIHSESHRKVEEELRQYVCDVCSHRLSTKAQLLIHMRKHFNGDYYMCDVCGKSYKFIAPFLHHKMGHENRFDFPCRYCEKKFRVSRDRMLHERIHTKERPYRCDQCQKAFAHKANYVSHLKTHETRAYACKLCGLQFSSATKLRQHEDEEHPEVYPFKCINCRKSFKAAHSLDAHKIKCFQGVEVTDDKNFISF